MSIPENGDVTEFMQQIDPAERLPGHDERAPPGFPADAVQLARGALNAVDGATSGAASPPVLAAAALYVSATALRGTVISQPDAAAAVDGGATDVSMRQWFAPLAYAALTLDLSCYESDPQDVVEARLQHLADGGTVPELPV